jgi:hypothetical protein
VHKNEEDNEDLEKNQVNKKTISEEKYQVGVST